MLTPGEQRELCQIGQGLRDADRGFAWRLTALQRTLRWAGPGRRAYLPVLVVLAVALLRLVATAGRLLAAYAEVAVLIEPMTRILLGDTAWPGRQPGPEPDRGASGLVRGRPQFDGTDPP
jgi:hypothetical protein